MSSIRILVGSKNPVKVAAAEAAFERVFSPQTILVEACHVSSHVAEQPMSEEETRQGAENRVQEMMQTHEADYYIAYEGGVDVFADGPKTFAILCICDKQRMSFGQTASLPLPLHVYQKLLQGKELGDAMDELFGTHNIKQKGGAIGQLTKGLESRQSIYTSATILALAPYMYPDLFV